MNLYDKFSESSIDIASLTVKKQQIDYSRNIRNDKERIKNVLVD